MRATVRLDDGRVVEGEVLIPWHYAPAVNACAGNALPFVYNVNAIGVAQFMPARWLPPPTNACAGSPTACWVSP